MYVITHAFTEVYTLVNVSVPGHNCCRGGPWSAAPLESHPALHSQYSRSLANSNIFFLLLLHSNLPLVPILYQRIASKLRATKGLIHSFINVRFSQFKLLVLFLRTNGLTFVQCRSVSKPTRYLLHITAKETDF